MELKLRLVCHKKMLDPVCILILRRLKRQAKNLALQPDITCVTVVTYTDASGNKINNNDERTCYLEKYTSHTLFEMVTKGLRKGYVWEVSWRLNRDCNILTPSSSVFSSTSFSFC